MLALLIGLLTTAGLLARGGWDVWIQSALFIAACGGTAAWLVWRVVVGYVPLPQPRLVLWVFVLAVLSGVSAHLSPVAAYAVPGWRAVLMGLWLFGAIAVVSKDERHGIDLALRIAGWTLVLLAFYQHYHDGIQRPPSALLNQNVFAGAILLLLPLAAEHRDWPLCGALLVCLAWSRSLGAFMGLAAALVLTRKGRETLGNYAGLAVLFACLVMIYGKLQSPDVLHRWQWWKAAWLMSWERPLLGFGPASYAHAAASYFPPNMPLASLFAHQHFLETAAEKGWPYLLLWGGGLAYFLRRGAPHKRFGALAVLVQSFWDYPLSLPAVFWVFCYYCASTTTQTSIGINVPHRKKALVGLTVVFLGAASCWWAGRSWRADRLKAQAIDSFREGQDPAGAVSKLRRSLALAEDPEAERALAEILLEGGDAQAAAAHLERAARLNPYRPSTWAALERLHLGLGDPEKGKSLRQEGERWCPSLRAPKS